MQEVYFSLRPLPKIGQVGWTHPISFPYNENMVSPFSAGKPFHHKECCLGSFPAIYGRVEKMTTTGGGFFNIYLVNERPAEPGKNATIYFI
jgi:hypothetical protein